MFCDSTSSVLFFFNDTATTEIYTLSLHDALPIWPKRVKVPRARVNLRIQYLFRGHHHIEFLDSDRKSTRLNSSHQIISYAVFCLKKKKEQDDRDRLPEPAPLGTVDHCVKLPEPLT